MKRGLFFVCNGANKGTGAAIIGRPFLSLGGSVVLQSLRGGRRSLMSTVVGPFSLERMVSAVEKVRRRLLKAATAFQVAKVPFAVAGDFAVAMWVSRVDEAAVRNTQDVDVLIRRQDFGAAKAALESAGFVYRHSAGIDAFLESATAKPRDAVHIVFANEKVREHEPIANPDVSESEDAEM